jgi:hypothetical protein
MGIKKMRGHYTCFARREIKIHGIILAPDLGYDHEIKICLDEVII